MQRFEYKVVPAPRKGEKARGLKSTEDRFAHALSRLMNEQAREGWEYQRTDTLPVEERAGLTGTRTVFQNMLVFRKELVAAAASAKVAPPAVMPEAEALDLAAKRAALTAQSGEGSAPKLVVETKENSAPSLGPAKSVVQ